MSDPELGKAQFYMEKNKGIKGIKGKFIVREIKKIDATLGLPFATWRVVFKFGEGEAFVAEFMFEEFAQEAALAFNKRFGKVMWGKKVKAIYPKGKPVKKDRWVVDCLDTFSSEWYGRKKFSTKERAETYATNRKMEIESNQPRVNAGSLQDRVYITDPEGNQRIV